MSAAGLSCVPFIGKSKHRKPMMRNESFRFTRERASKLLYRLTTTTFCLAPVGTQYVWHHVFGVRTALVRWGFHDQILNEVTLKCMFIP